MLTKKERQKIDRVLKMAKDFLWEQTPSDIKAKLTGKALANVEYEDSFQNGT